MRGTVYAYYIYVIIFFLTLLGSLATVGGASAVGLPGKSVAGLGLAMLPQLLFVGWIAWVLQRCAALDRAAS